LPLRGFKLYIIQPLASAILAAFDLAYALTKWFLCSVQVCSEDFLIISGGLVTEAEQSKKAVQLYITPYWWLHGHEQ
jgi:hypothetical protein